MGEILIDTKIVSFDSVNALKVEDERGKMNVEKFQKIDSRRKVKLPYEWIFITKSSLYL